MGARGVRRFQIMAQRTIDIASQTCSFMLALTKESKEVSQYSNRQL